ncbi:MAG: pilus assembly protein [Microthrixaceae bacterium]|nr:pilus assembly protein [Microthrixaceae bacterium]
MTRLLVARRARPCDERGTVLVETAIVALLLMSLLVGTFELGMGWRSSITNSNSARAGARVSAYQGTGYQADYASLLAVSSGLKSLSRLSVVKVIIFKATTGSPTVPSSCLALSPTASTTTPVGLDTASTKCNVYSGSQLNAISAGTITAANFGAGTGAAGPCAASKLDYYWCPFDRANLQATGLDDVGVYVEVSHPTFSGMFGSSFTIRDTEIMQIEPSATGA